MITNIPVVYTGIQCFVHFQIPAMFICFLRHKKHYNPQIFYVNLRPVFTRYAISLSLLFFYKNGFDIKLPENVWYAIKQKQKKSQTNTSVNKDKTT